MSTVVARVKPAPRCGEMSRSRLFALLRYAGYRIELGGGKHPVKVRLGDGPGRSVAFAHQRTYDREQLGNYRRQFRHVFGCAAPF